MLLFYVFFVVGVVISCVCFDCLPLTCFFVCVRVCVFGVFVWFVCFVLFVCCLFVLCMHCLYYCDLLLFLGVRVVCLCMFVCFRFVFPFVLLSV